ncbi:MAG: alpha/beta hydrolase [Myxococcales bacterium]|nr:alpha/beta hydrolase [Myxococcales bacterium]
MLVAPAINKALGDVDQQRITTDDGVELLVQSFGRGQPVLFANGIGVRYPAAVRQIAALRARGCRVICWDYRGVGQSVMSRDGDLSMPRHARDALQLLAQLGIGNAVVIGWSMGVQVGLEMLRLAPERMAGFVALLGSFGIPFRTAFPEPIARQAESLFVVGHKNPALLQRALDLAVAAPNLAYTVLTRLRFVGRSVDRAVFEAAVRSVAGVDKHIYARQMLELADHDASDMLTSVRCPVLVIAGTRDHLTPPRVAQQMARSIPRAIYREVAEGSHFALMEQPELINSWLLEHIDESFAQISSRNRANAPDSSHSASAPAR